jgi:CHAD domain-containing protein
MTTKQFATGVIVELYNAIIAHEQGAIDGNVEAIHDMRVGIRRLRVALSNFASIIPREDRRHLQACLKQLAEPLGQVRDFDVMIAALESSLTDKSRADAIKSVIGRLRERRRRRLHNLKNYLSGKEYADFKRGFSTFEAEASELSGLSREESNKLKNHGQAA